jgi:hypothetical protein
MQKPRGLKVTELEQVKKDVARYSVRWAGISAVLVRAEALSRTKKTLKRSNAGAGAWRYQGQR